MGPKVAIVTGGNKGIGFAIVRALCKQFRGDVFLTSRDINRGQAAVKSLESEGLHPKFYQLDITDTASINKLYEFIKTNYGGVDVLVNNAGFAFKQAATNPFDEQARVTVAINFTATLNMTNMFLPLVNDDGRIAIVSSGSAVGSFKRCSAKRKAQFTAADITMEKLKELMGEFIEAAKTDSVAAGFSTSAYGMSKLGVTVATQILAKDVSKYGKRGILINCCCPGWVKTDMAGDRAPKTPDEGAIIPVYLSLLPAGATEPQGQYLKDNRVVDWWR